MTTKSSKPVFFNKGQEVMVIPCPESCEYAKKLTKPVKGKIYMEGGGPKDKKPYAVETNDFVDWACGHQIQAINKGAEE